MYTELQEQDNEQMDDITMINEDKKYELTDETIEWNEHTLHRIRALKGFLHAETMSGNLVDPGTLGGWIESEDNLSQEGDCWVWKDAKVYDGAVVYGDGVIGGEAEVYGDGTEVYESGSVFGKSKVFDGSKIHGVTCIRGNSTVRNSDVVNSMVLDEDIVNNEEVPRYRFIDDDAPIADDTDNLLGDSVGMPVNPSKKDLLFIESIANLGLSEVQMEAVMRIHDIAYSEKSLNEGKLSNAIGAGLIGAASLLSPANAQNVNDNWIDYGGGESDSLTTEQVQERNKEMADRYLKSVINTKSWDAASTATANDNPVNSGEYKNTLRPIKDLDDAIDYMNEELSRHIDMNIDIDEQLKVSDKEKFSDNLDKWSDELLEKLKKLAVESGDDMEHLNTFGIGYTKNGDKANAEELAIKDAIKTFKDRASVPEGYKLVLYPDVAKFVLSLPDGNGRWYERSVVGVVVHLVSDDEYEDVPEHLRIGDLKPTF